MQGALATLLAVALASAPATPSAPPTPVDLAEPGEEATEPEPTARGDGEPVTPPPAAVVPETSAKTAHRLAPPRRGANLRSCMAERGPCWRMNVAGWTLAAVGVASLAIGSTFLALDQRAIADDPMSLRRYRIPGAVTTAAGGSLLLGGIVLVFTGLALHRKTLR